MNQDPCELVIKARGAGQVRMLCDVLTERMHIQAMTNNGVNRDLNTKLGLINGVTLEFSLLTTYSIEPALPVRVDSSGRLVNADITIKYLEAVK